MATPATGIRELSLVILPVSDQDRSIGFYESLGLEKRTDQSFADGTMRWVEVYPPGGTTGIALSAQPSGTDVTAQSTGITLTTEDIDATHAAFSSCGVDVDAEVMRFGDPVPPMFWFRDPDGHKLLVVQRRD